VIKVKFYNHAGTQCAQHCVVRDNPAHEQTDAIEYALNWMRETGEHDSRAVVELHNGETYEMFLHHQISGRPGKRWK
jgi:hypothetical protein